MFNVIRKAVLMEDEGRESIVANFSSRAKAEAWIAAQTAYFRPHDYYIAPHMAPQLPNVSDLRDYFAAAALQGMIASGRVQAGNAPMLAQNAYEVAEIMLAERAK